MKAFTGLLRCAPDGALRARGPRVQVAPGLGLLLVVALAGCTAFSPSGSQAPVVTIARVADSAGDPLQFEVRAEPAPAADLTVGVTIEPVGCTLAQSPESVTIAAGESVATLAVPVTGVEVGAQGCEVIATIAAGTGYAVGLLRSIDVNVNVDSPSIPTPPAADRLPGVSIRRLVAEVTEGGHLRFELTADPAPAAPLTVNLRWSDPGRSLSGSPPRTVTIPISGTVTVTAYTKDDDKVEEDREVSVTVLSGSGYAATSPASSGIKVRDNDKYPVVTVEASAASVPEGGTATFTLSADPVPTSDLTIKLSWVGNIASRMASDTPPPTTVTIPAFSSMLQFSFRTVNDLIDNYDGDDGGLGIQIRRGNGYVPGDPGTATVMIIDDEFTPIVTISTPSTSVNEGDTISLTLTAAPPEARFTLSPVTVNLTWSVSAGRLPGVDKVKVNGGNPLPQTVTIPASGTNTITVPTRDDSLYNRDYTVRVDIADGDGDYFGVGNHVTITVNEDESP